MADKKFNVTFNVDANVTPFKTAVSQIQGALDKVNVPATFKKGLESTLKSLNNEISNFESLANKGFHNLGDVNKAEKSFDKINDLFGKLNSQVKDFKGIDPNKFLPPETLKKTNELQKSWLQLKKTVEAGTGNTNEINKQTQELEKQKRTADELREKFEALQSKNENLNQTRSDLATKLKEARDRANEVVAAMEKLEAQKGGKSSAEYKRLSGELSAANKVIIQTEAEFNKLGIQIDKNSTQLSDYKNQITTAESSIVEINNTLKELEQTANQSPQGLEELRRQLAEFKGVDISKIPTDIDEIGREINELNADQLRNTANQIKDLGNKTQAAAPALSTLGREMNNAANDAKNLASRTTEIEQLANRIKYFFSIGNTVMLFRRSIKSAIDTVKELDEVMTQAAVVTKFTVSDMWAQLPDYAKRANELGVTIKGVYEASTLYYQQGLDTVQVIGVANETLKMAKIAGIDYATATNYMTSALRGFNMEVNETSAQKVNDIYSQLAAHTASNVEEISTAMSKVAPLAHNAGMEIETTAAMLAQMIEKTREAPETLGTAMKTVIARFQELKKDPALIEPVDGEIVDANKVEAALRTVGVALRDSTGQFRELDDVFLEISQKWDSLDTNTQRYIATIAAGSRQQSRFIAMMADYERTTQLVSMANNSAGASSEQFQKTQESLATALNRLKVAWDQFTMGLANNQIIKVVINLITSLIKTVNNASNTFSRGSGFLKSLFDIGALTVGIKVAKAAFNGFFAWLIKAGKTKGVVAGAEAGAGFGAGINRSLASVQKIFTKSTWIGKGNNFAFYQKEIEGLNQALLKTNLTQEQTVALKNKLEAATIKYNAALAAATANVTLNNAQQEVSNLLTEYDVSASLAKAAAVSGLTKKEVLENIVTTEGNVVDAEATKVKLESIAATKAQEGAEAGLIKVEQAGLLTKAKAVAMLLFALDPAKRKDAMETLGMASADAVATGAQLSLNAAMEACPIGFILLAVAALTAAFIGLAKAEKANSLEGRMEAAAEATDLAKKEAQSAKEAYDQLLEDQSGYQDLQNTLEDLTYGTQQWKEALLEVNQQVLELLQTYPELKKYLGRGDYGQLIITDKGWDAVIEDQYNTMIGTQGAASYSQLVNYNLQKEAYDTALNKKFSYYDVGLSGEVEEFIDTDTKKAIEDAISNGVVKDFADAIGEVGETSKLSATQIEAAGQAMLEYNENVRENELQMENTAKAFLTFSMDADKVKRLKGIDGAAEFIVDYFSEQMLEAAKNGGSQYEWEFTAADVWRSDGQAEWQNNEVFTKLANQYSDKIAALGSMAGDDVKDLRLLLAAMLDSTIADVEKEYGKNKNKMATKIAELANGMRLADVVDDFTTQFLQMSSDVQKAFMFTKSNGSNYLGDRKQIKKTVEYLRDNWENLNDATKKIILDTYGTLDNFVEAYDNAFTESNKEFQKIKERIIQSMLDNGAFRDSRLMEGALNGLSDTQLLSFGAITDQISVLDKETQKVLLTNLPYYLQQFQTETENLFASLDFSDPIDALLVLQNTAEGAAGRISAAIQYNEKEMFEAGNLFKNLYQDASFDKIDEALQDIAKDGKRITSGNIKELAKSHEKLNKLLQTGKLNAEGLASAFNAYEQAGVPLDYFTTRVLEALSVTRDFDEVLLDLQDHYNNFDPGIDEGFGFDFLSDSLEKMQDFTESFEYGNEAFQGYFKEVFGEEALAEVLRNQDGTQVREAFDQWLNKLEGWLSGDAYGFFYDVANNEQWADLGVTLAENGDILIDVADQTTDEVLKKFTEKTGLPEETISAFLAQFSAHSIDWKKELGWNDYEARITALCEGAQTITKQELWSFAVATGKTLDEVTAYAEDHGIKVVDWIDTDTGVDALGDDLWEQVQNQLWKHAGEFDIQQFLSDSGVTVNIDPDTDQAYIDIENLKTALGELGLSEEQIASIASNIQQAISQAMDQDVVFSQFVDVPTRLTDGNGNDFVQMTQERVSGLDFESLTASVNARLEAADYDIVSSSIVNQDFSKLGDNVYGAIHSAAVKAASSIASEIRNTKIEGKNLEVTVTYKEVNKPALIEGTIKSGQANYGIKTTGSTSSTNSGRNRLAEGSSGLPHAETALTGEEGYELAYDSHGAFVLGANGPELAKLEKGTVIYPHDVSEKILKGRSKKSFPNHATGVWSAEQISATHSFYGVSAAAAAVNEIAETMEDINEETEEWENKYDWLYNLTQQINEELRIREKLERRYDRLLKTHAGSGAELKKITDEELASLQKRQALEEKMIQLRREELKEYLAANAALAKYATINWDLEVVQIDWKAIDAVTDPETGEAIEKYIDRLEFIIDEIKNAEDALEDIEDDIIELKERGKEQYKDLEDRVLDALISEQQELIDEQEKINDSITEAASSLTDAISKNIQKMRQDRQNEETETSIAEKERRLAYLRQDTTGSNALEIKKLEQDLAKEKENYQDALIDQSLNDLKEQNDAAAEQREKQIELAQSQLDWQEKTGYYADEATRIVREGLGPNGVMSENTRLYQLLYNQEGVETMSNASREWWKEELGDTIHEAFVYLQNILGGSGGSQSSGNRDIMAEMIAQSNKGKSANANMTTLGNLEQERNQKIRDNGLQDTYPETNMVGSYNRGKNSYNSSTDKDVDWMAEIDKEIAKAEPNWSNAFYYAGKRDAKIESETVDSKYASDWTFDMVFDRWYASTKSKKFKKGGLADFTGPAWLDGTKSKPEMVLNAKDTENFIQLKDILAGLRSNLVGANNSSGDWYFDIDINVDEIANDYDVDKVAERIKQSIYNETMYRNVNAINFLK